MCTLQYLCLCTYLVCVCDEPINQTVCVGGPGSCLSSPHLLRKHPLGLCFCVPVLSSLLYFGVPLPPAQPPPWASLSPSFSRGGVESVSRPRRGDWPCASHWKLPAAPPSPSRRFPVGVLVFIRMLASSLINATPVLAQGHPQRGQESSGNQPHSQTCRGSAPGRV